MASENPILSRSLTLGPLDATEQEVLAHLPGLSGASGQDHARRGSTTPDATVVLDGTTVRLGPAATEAVLSLLSRLASGATVTVSEQERWLNTSQAARLAGVSNTYLRQLADRGEIPVTYRGTHRRIHPDDVTAWVSRREQEREQENEQERERGKGRERHETPGAPT